MADLLDMAGMKGRIAACLAFEEGVVKRGALHYVPF